MRIGPRDRSRILTSITVCAILLVASFLCWPLIPRSEPESPFGIVESITVKDPLVARPDPRFTPRHVVDIQLRALEHARENDEGFATCFAFASPDNKRSTGPVDRFKQMIGSPPYDALLGCCSAEVVHVAVQQHNALVFVYLIDEERGRHGFVFSLSRRTDGPQAGCWMTDAVQPLAQPPRSSDPPRPLIPT